MKGADLHAIRKALGLRQIDLAPLLGITSEHLGKLERGEARITKATELLLNAIKEKRDENN
jgi:DNA-binding transcriptional regulator YiaG